MMSSTSFFEVGNMKNAFSLFLSMKETRCEFRGVNLFYQLGNY